VLSVGSSFLFDTSPEPSLRKMVPRGHPRHTWDLRARVWSGKSQFPCFRRLRLHGLTSSDLGPMWSGPFTPNMLLHKFSTVLGLTRGWYACGHGASKAWASELRSGLRRLGATASEKGTVMASLHFCWRAPATCTILRPNRPCDNICLVCRCRGALSLWDLWRGAEEAPKTHATMTKILGSLARATSRLRQYCVIVCDTLFGSTFCVFTCLILHYKRMSPKQLIYVTGNLLYASRNFVNEWINK
jgi:hypothetical protein